MKEIKKATIHHNQGKLSRGESLSMPNKMLISLSKVDPKFFVKEVVKVTSKEISLKSLISSYEKVTQQSRMIALIEELANCDIETLRASYPNCFTVEALDKFIGAEEQEPRPKSRTRGRSDRRMNWQMLETKRLFGCTQFHLEKNRQVHK